MKKWQKDKKWSDKFLPEIKSILGVHLIGEPPQEEDAERNTDLMVLKMDAVRIGCRIRKYKYIERYQDEFTIRAGRPSGIKTELAKIIEGWGDYFFYGFADNEEKNIRLWRLADLKVFRAWFSMEIIKKKGAIPGRQKKNIDNSSNFISFTWREIPENFVIAQSVEKRVDAYR